MIRMLKMVPMIVLILLQDYLYFDDFKSLSEAHYITTPSIEYLIDSYCKSDIPHKLQYLMDRSERKNMKYLLCNSALNNSAYLCVNMLMKDYGMLITMLVYEYDMLNMFNYLKSNNLISHVNSLTLGRKNRVLEALVQLYEEGILYRPSLYYELEQLGYYELLNKVYHVYYKR